jgi:formylglycine-generating enzyme required for sulfatase activity
MTTPNREILATTPNYIAPWWACLLVVSVLQQLTQSTSSRFLESTVKRLNQLLLTFLLLSPFSATATYADIFGSGPNTFDIEFVSIGNPGNVADTGVNANPNPAGKVDYTYRIGKYVISEDMINKANAEGNLFITHTGRGANKPATDVSWFEAIQFVNWLNTSTGSTPAYKYAGLNFRLWEPGNAGYDPNNLFRNSLATYFLPSVDEWYKAAYYDPNRPGGAGYYDFPTGEDAGPEPPDGIDFPGDTIFTAVFFDGGSNAGPNDITNVGLLSPYGTAGQGGNVYELHETESDLVNDSDWRSRVKRGGYWQTDSNSIATFLRSSTSPHRSIETNGFRVAVSLSQFRYQVTSTWMKMSMALTS